MENFLAAKFGLINSFCCHSDDRLLLPMKVSALRKTNYEIDCDGYSICAGLAGIILPGAFRVLSWMRQFVSPDKEAHTECLAPEKLFRS